MMVVTTGAMERRTSATHVGEQRSSRADSGTAAAGSLFHMPGLKASTSSAHYYVSFVSLASTEQRKKKSIANNFQASIFVNFRKLLNSAALNLRVAIPLRVK